MQAGGPALTGNQRVCTVRPMQRHRSLLVVSGPMVLAGFFKKGWGLILHIVGEDNNMPIAELIPLSSPFTYLSLSAAFRHDRLIEMYP